MSELKNRTAVDLAFEVPEKGARLHQWLYEQIRSAILEGRLKRGAKLPPSRDLARHYGLSRGTAVAAFDLLKSEGYLEGRMGAGTYVNTLLPEDFSTAERSGTVALTPPRKHPIFSGFGNRLGPVPDMPGSPPRPFRPEPAIEEFPLQSWAQITGRCLRRASRSLLSDSDSRGYRPLRAAIADYLGAARGVRCTADQVIVVSGIQHGLDLAARLVLDPGDPVSVEDPCHPMISAMFTGLGARLVPTAVDDHGMDVDRAEQQCRRPKLIYVTPAHQFPLGATMPIGRRLSLLEWAGRSGALIFEDDYDSEYRFAGRPIPAIQGQDHAGSVILSGSFSKVLLPILRLGYLVVPMHLVDKFAAARFYTDRHSSTLDQAVMCEFLTQGYFGRHVRRMRELYGGRLATLREAVHSRLAGLMTIPDVEAGIHVTALLARGLKSDAVAAALAAVKVETIPIRQFVLATARPEALLLGFAPYDARQIRDGVDRMAGVIEQLLRNARPGRRPGRDQPMPA
jgi:GntR family transcriptional regulator/MocR family aminotransferase